MSTTNADEVKEKVVADGPLDEKSSAQEEVDHVTYERPKGLRGLYAHPRTQVSILLVFVLNSFLMER